MFANKPIILNTFLTKITIRYVHTDLGALQSYNFPNIPQKKPGERTPRQPTPYTNFLFLETHH